MACISRDRKLEISRVGGGTGAKKNSSDPRFFSSIKKILFLYKGTIVLLGEVSSSMI